MEAAVRKPFQGVINIIRFNWHFYVIAVAIIGLLITSVFFLPPHFTWIPYSIILVTCLSIFITLVVSYYVYDYSGLYSFEWLKELSIGKDSRIVNINAGFDETSSILSDHYPQAELKVFDFYNPQKHTEVSIERARKAYAAYPGTKEISTLHIPVDSSSVDFIFNIFALHEIRDIDERINFLRKQNSLLKPEGRCILVEHLRDVPNFMAYNIGYFHFYSLREWQRNFSVSGFSIERIIKITPFVKVFILKKNNGNTH